MANNKVFIKEYISKKLDEIFVKSDGIFVFSRKNIIQMPMLCKNYFFSMQLKRKVAIGRFSNEAQYAKGILYDKENDPMGKQTLDILFSKLAASGKFLLLERRDLASLISENSKEGEKMTSIDVDYIIIGSITEFGRKKRGVFSTPKNKR